MKSNLILPSRIDEFIQLYYTKGMTYEKIGRHFGLTKNQIQRLVSRWVDQGFLERRNSPRSKKYLNMSEQALINEINKFKTADNSPNALYYAVKKHFGSWSNGVIAALGDTNTGGLFDSDKTTIVYLLEFDDFIKVGITQQPLEKRFKKFPQHSLIDSITTDLDNAKKIESSIHKKLIKYSFNKIPPGLDRNGYTECFYKPIGFSKNYTIETLLENFY